MDANDITKITYGFLTGNLWGSSLTDGYDTAASAARYEEQLREALAEVFPHATIEIEHQDGEGVPPLALEPHAWTSEREWVDDAEILDAIERASNEVWERGEWMVRVTA